MVPTLPRATSLGRRRPRTALCRVLSVLALGACSAFTAASCTTEPTEIVAGNTTQIQVPKDLQAVGVVVRFGGTLISCKSYPLTDGTVTLPSTLGLVPQEGRGDEVLEPVTYTVLGFRTAEQGLNFDDTCVASLPSADSPEVVVMRSKRVPYLTDHILYLPMPLRESCTGVACDDTQTCVGGVCEDNLVDPATLSEYQDSFVFGDANTCFDVDICLPTGITQPAIVVDPDTCTFRYPVLPDQEPPDVPAGNLNVEIVYSSFGTEILDLDDKEGFVFPDANDPLTFKLADNLCESNYKTGKILAVFASPTCAAKPPLQPICSDDMAGIQAGDRSPQADTPEPLCTLGEPLVPSESALYVLLDRSASMSDLYGPSGLEFAVNIPLKNPVAARTQLALSFLPADSSDCSTSSYLTPDFGFDDVDTLRSPIGTALSAPDTLLSTDPELYLDGAMAGAYSALLAAMPLESARFNRRALIIVGNRDLQSHCAPSPGTATELAQAAKAQGIFTYAAVLDAPAGAPQFGDDPQASAASIATAGGTTVFDAIADESEGALAVQKVFNDLGSCVYDPPSSLVRNFATHLSFVDPVTLDRTDIPRNDACNGEAAAEVEDGWGLESDGAVRICGPSCASLRQTLTDTASSFAVLGQPAPKIPIVASVPCDDPNRFELPP
ncbi:MAG: hypothetical protein U0271_30540 [Polyangiaceae bacterium]